jgi:hypothetical protein
MEGRQNMTGYRNVMKGLRETHGNSQEGPNGDRIRRKCTGGMANHRETSEGRRRRARVGVYIKVLHYALNVIMEIAGHSRLGQ